MNWAMSHVGGRGEPGRVVQNGSFYRRRVSKKVISKRKGVFQARWLFLREKSKGSYPVDHLIFLWGVSVADSLALIEKFLTDR